MVVETVIDFRKFFHVSISYDSPFQNNRPNVFDMAGVVNSIDVTQALTKWKWCELCMDQYWYRMASLLSSYITYLTENHLVVYM